MRKIGRNVNIICFVFSYLDSCLYDVKEVQQRDLNE